MNEQVKKMVVYLPASPEDIYAEMERRGLLKKMWKTKDGRKIDVKEMTDEHLCNVAKMLFEQEYTEDVEVNVNNEDWYK